MFAYWLLFGFPALMALVHGLRGTGPEGVWGRVGRRIKPLWWLFALLVVLAVGYRFRVGCDWGTYLKTFDFMAYATIPDALARTDPAYALINWATNRLGWGIGGTNLVCAIVFAFGLFRYCARQPSPWLTVMAAVPYLIIVVAMGYTRQAAALGVLLLAYNAFVDRRLLLFLGFVAGAALFHRSAVVLAPLAIFIPTQVPLWRIIFSALATFILVRYVANDAIDRYVYGYIESEYEGGAGAFFRLPLNVLAAVVFLANRKKWGMRYNDGRLMMALSLVSMALLPLSYFYPVAADRIGLYVLIIQVTVFTRLPDLYRSFFHPVLATVVVVLAYAASHYVWLNYANHARCWVPYQSSLLKDLRIY